MMESYLEELKSILEKNNYADTDNTIAYFREMILDRKENGEEESDILNELGEAKELAKKILGDMKINIEDEKANSIYAKLISADLNIIKTNKTNIEIIMNNPEKFEIKEENDIYMIKEIPAKLKLVSHEENTYVNIYVPSDLFLERVDIETVAGDIDMSFIGDITNLKTISGDVKIELSRLNKIECKTISGDVSILSLESDDINISSKSGDININGLSTSSIKLSTISGDIKNINVNSNTLESSSVSGDIKAYIKADSITCKTKSGDVIVSVDDLQDEYHVEVNNIGDKKRATKSLIINTISGDCDYTFKE